MTRFIVLAAVAILLYRWFVGRWPWERKVSTREHAILEARKLLGVSAQANRTDINAAHKRLIAMVHPDRGGTNSQVHEANAARDLLLQHLPHDHAGDDKEPQ